MEHPNTEELWVFAYGSLMWNPGFDFQERRVGTLDRHRRSFCLASIIYRGTPEAPGLVLALEEHNGARCKGLVYRVAAERRSAVFSYLREREMSNGSYHERMLPIRLDEGGEIEALCYVINTGHDQYRGTLSEDEKALTLARSQGPAGPNIDYLEHTVRELRALGVHDAEIETLLEKARDLRAQRL